MCIYNPMSTLLIGCDCRRAVAAPGVDVVPSTITLCTVSYYSYRPDSAHPTSRSLSYHSSRVFS